MRSCFERILGKAAVVGFLDFAIPRVHPPKLELTPSGRETLLSLIDRCHYPLKVRVREYRVFGS